jgi:hypothetical protein
MLVLLVSRHSKTVILDLLFLAFRRLNFKKNKKKDKKPVVPTQQK